MGMEKPVSSIKGTGNQLMIIDGKRVAAASGETIDVFDPSTGQLIGTSPAGDVEDVNRAVAAAKRAFDSGIWKNLHGSERAKILWRASDILESRAAELSELEALNSGMLLPMAQGMMHGAIETLRYFAGWATKIYGQTSEISGAMGNFHAYTLRDPVGVCAAIIPWNVPVVLTVTKLAAGLAAGCTMIIKPSEETPLTALVLWDILKEAGVPDGVVNIVTGYGHTAGAALAAHDDVAKIAFTGSTEVGKLIVKAAAGNLKKVTLELGGKSPVVVFDDADLSKVPLGVASGIFLHAGQICIAGSRLYVQKKSFDKVISSIADIAKNMKVGSCFDPATQIGPLISQKQMERVNGLIASGMDEGAELVTGGKRVGNSGYFMQPTIMINPKSDARIVKEEIFGPVLTAMPFDDINDIAREANNTTYGLASAVWTQDISKAHMMAKKLQAGFVWINCAFISDVSLPGGGFKQSGWGREMGQEGLDAYLQTKSVFTAL
jgi:phenylacetaldehyde dehydrogenase